jgi:RNA polymerase sigma-70 factor (ECF subfamily)
MTQVGDEAPEDHLSLMAQPPLSALAPWPGPEYDRGEFIRHLYEEHGPHLMSYVLRLTLGDRHRAEDVIQETLLRAWRNAESLTPERGSVRGWLMRVAHNVTIDGYRATKARPAEVAQDNVAETSVRDRCEDVLTALDVKRALSQLSLEHRAVLVEVYIRDRTAAEAARVLGIPVGTVKSRIHYALRILRVMFDEERERTK